MAAPTKKDTKLIKNERIKLFASYLNTISTTALAAGVFTPLIGVLYTIPSSSSASDTLTLEIGTASFIFASLMLHLSAIFLLRRLRA